MADQPLALRSDADLESALRAFGEEVAWPEATATDGRPRRRGDGPCPDRGHATDRRTGTAALELVAGPPRPRRRRPHPAGPGGSRRCRHSWPPRPATDPGPGAGEPAPESRAEGVVPAAGASPAAGAPGSTMGLGQLVPLDQLDAQAGFAVAWPQDPALGPPDAAYVDPSARRPGRTRLAIARRPPRHPRTRGRARRDRIPGRPPTAASTRRPWGVARR